MELKLDLVVCVSPFVLFCCMSVCVCVIVCVYVCFVCVERGGGFTGIEQRADG